MMDIRILAHLLMICGIATSTAGAPTDLPDAGLRLADTPPTFAGVHAAADRILAENCRARTCQAMLAINKLRLIAEYVFDRADMTGHDRILYSPRLVWQRYRRALLDRTDIHESVCSLGRSLLRNLPPHPEEIALPVILLAASVDIDLLDHDHCVATMIAALPASAAVEQIRRNAAESCRSPFDDHPRPLSACAKLLQGLPPPIGTSHD